MAKKQTTIPGTEGKRIKEIDRAAEAYVDVLPTGVELE